VDKAEIKRRIAALARADAGQDEARKALIGEARKADMGDFLPENWADDGSLKDARAWSAEQRDTANDVFAALRAAVEDAYGDTYDCYWVWVQDWYGAGTADDPYMVVFMAGDSLYAAEFSYDEEQKVVLGEPVKVRPVTSYVARSASAEQRNVAHLLEWRKKKAASLGGLERREFSSAAMEIRDKDDDTWNLTGFASVTEEPYEVGFYTETIRANAFKRTLGERPDVQLLVNHTDLPLARTLSGTLRLEERVNPDANGKRGLWVDADLDKLDPDAQRLERKMSRGDVDAMSFAFQVTDQDWNDDFTQRDIKSLSLHRGDVSVVNQGANPAAVASMRSAAALDTLHDLGPEAFVAAWTEWRDHTLLPREQRAGKTLSAPTMETLSQVLNLIAAGDDALDEAQPLLADLMGVPNPDAADDATEGDERRRPTMRRRAPSCPTTRPEPASGSRC
jgi:HK97 family phage prohead protease